MTYPGKQGEESARKYLKLETDGNFSNSTVSDDYLNADIIVDKVNAGILLQMQQDSLTHSARFNNIDLSC